MSEPFQQQQLRSQAQEIGKLQGKVDVLQSEKRELMVQLDRPPKEQLVDSIVRSFSAGLALSFHHVILQ